MNSYIEEKIKTLVTGIQSPFQQLSIRIECPLDSGIKVECWRVIDQEKISQAIPGGVRVFFQFIELIRKNEPSREFNVVTITADKTATYTVSFEFDAAVQRDAEENIKQA